MLPLISIYKTITASSPLTLSSTGRGSGSPKLPFMNRKPQQTSYYTIATNQADLHNNSLLPNKRTINKQFMSQYQLSTLECYLPETDWSTILGGIESAFNYLRSVPRGIKPHQGKDAGLNYYIKTSLKWQTAHYL